MYDNKTLIILFSLITSLIGVFITFGRKTMFKKYDVETIYFIDLILSTIFVLFFRKKEVCCGGADALGVAR